MRGVFLALLFAVPGAAWGAEVPARTRLDYERTPAAATCPDEQAMRRSVAERLGYDPFHPEGSRALRARVDRSATEWTVDIQLLDAQGALIGERQLSSPGGDCTELASSAALAIAIALDPLVLARPAPAPTPAAAAPTDDDSGSGWVGFPGSPPPPRPVVTAREPSVTRTEAPVEPAPSAPATPGNRRLQFGMVALGALGAAPSATVGGTLSAGARFGGLYLGAEFRADLPGLAPVGRGAVQAGQLTGAAVVCGQAGWLGACGVLSAGVLQSEALNVPAATQATSPLVALGPRLFLDIPFGTTVRLRFQAELVAQIVRSTLVVGQVEVWQTPVVSASAGSGLIIALPL